MKNKPFEYLESHKINVNTFLLFYVSVTVIMIIANILSLSTFNYLFSFTAGLMAICLLFIKAVYKITITDQVLKISIKIFIKIVLFKIDLRQIVKVEEITTDADKSSFYFSSKKTRNILYIIKTPMAIKLTMSKNKFYIFSTVQSKHLIDLINANQ